MRLSAQEALWLKSVADGEQPAGGDAPLDRLVVAGLVRLIPAEDVALVQGHRLKRSGVEDLREQARLIERPGGLRAVVRALFPPARQAASRRAWALRDQADAMRDEAQGQWLELSRRGLVHLDLDLCAPAQNGALLAITDPGRDALREFLHSDHFEQHCVNAEAAGERAQRCLALREELLTAGFEQDPRLDLAAALISRADHDVARFRCLTRLASFERWVSYDRLPLLAALCRFSGEPERVWERFWEDYQTMRRHDYPGDYETRFATVALMRWRPVDDAVCGRFWEVLKRLRRDGWSMGLSTLPVAARLTALRLSPTRVAARVRTLLKELRRGPDTDGPFLLHAAAIAADSNLHRLSPRSDSTEVMRRESPYTPFVERYDEVLPQVTGKYSWVTAPAAVAALMPGQTAENWRRVQCIAALLAPQVAPPQALPLALLLADAAYPEWFDATRFLWEIGNLMEPTQPTSVFGTFWQEKAFFEGFSQAAYMVKPG